MGTLGQLYQLSLIDSLCFGLVVPMLPPFILSLGGNHFILGTLAMLHNGLQLLSGPLTRSLVECYGKKFTLMLTIFIGLVSNIGLCFAALPWLVVIIRSAFSSTNQTQTLCKHLVSENVPKEQHEGIYGLMGMFGVIGFVIGPVITGHLLDTKNGVIYICLLATFLQLLSLMITKNLNNKNTPQKELQPGWYNKFFTNVVSEFTVFCTNLQKSSWHKNWCIIIMRFLYCCTLTIFFTKFVVLLKSNYSASASIIGYIIAYQSILLFCSNFVVPFVNQKFYKNDGSCFNRLVQGSTVLAVSLIGLCYAPTYDVYLLSVIPLALSRTLLDNAWKEFFKYHSNNKNDLDHMMDAVNIASTLIVPFLFGGLCDLFGPLAIKMFTIIPTSFIVLLAMTYKTKVEIDAKNK